MHIREVKFLGEIGPLGEQRLCKIKCIAGQWTGPLCSNRQGLRETDIERDPVVFELVYQFFSPILPVDAISIDDSQLKK
ncbi:hypothetical protein NQ315_013353 [Exocentrus adspersus]|uniref:Uncharacterized protein n=1 Tax=Exocentrus adspersus TaxID=1586481 RepID=A0AAV8VS26_9CUCU|nr:hypothetical protein NQ315_013353 [Exocentrus adspersus]